MKTHFYDLESLLNAFTNAMWKPEDNHVDLYYLLDEPYMRAAMKDPMFQQELTAYVKKVNKNFTGTISYHDLKEHATIDKLFTEIGLSDAFKVNTPNDKSTYPAKYRPICDTDEGYDQEEMPYYMGYNSDNYDLTMLAIFASECFAIPRKPPVAVAGQPLPDMTAKQLRPEAELPTAKTMREHNNRIFRNFKKNMPEYLKMSFNVNPRNGNVSMSDEGWNTEKRRIWKNFKLSGRHVDVSKLNEKQQKVALKRIIGMLGGQILESDKLDENKDTLDNLEELKDLIAYNISDSVNLDLIVFRNKLYRSQFILKRNLLKKYPELVYEKKTDAYAPDISPSTVRKDRLFVDSSSAQLSTKSLCPYGHLTDIPAVSFMYPHPEKAKELGIQPKNVLEETKAFFYRNFPDEKNRREFDRIYDYYKSIEGRNFNESDNYRADYAGTPRFVPYSDIKSIPKGDMSLMYFKADGSPTNCFVNFSIGGIHGAECNLDLWQYHHDKWQKEKDLLEEAKSRFPDPVELRKAGKIEINGKIYSWGRFLKTGANMTHAVYKDIDAKEPKLFVEKSGKTEINSKYTFTSADLSEHEDFKSYYPNLLRMMMAFYNKGLGYDRYAEIFDNKEYYGFLMKPKNAHLSPENAAKYRHLREGNGFEIDEFVISDKERAYYDDQRDGTKLILNSATGAADANFESNIRMNNMIISMRIIGQLFTYRIGQAQAMKGARIISTNTDGLYSVMSLPDKSYDECRKFNNNILEQEAKDIGVEIEPETLYLISKDTNNRLEADYDKGTVEKANGGSLACFRGPDPQKSLAHSALQDWALTEYLYYMSTDPNHNGHSINQPFNRTVGMNILKSASSQFKGWKLLNMFQTVLASSVSSITYIFGIVPPKENDVSGEPKVEILRHYNRVFFVKKDPAAMDTLTLHAACGRVITDTVAAKRKRENAPEKMNDPLAIMVIKRNGVEDVMEELGPDREAKICKINGVEEDWHAIVVNGDLTLMSQEEIDGIMDRIDYDAYLQLLEDCFESNWRNRLAEDEIADDKAVEEEERRKQEEKERAAAEKAAKKQAEKERKDAEKAAKKAQKQAKSSGKSAKTAPPAAQDTDDADTGTTKQQASDATETQTGDNFPMPLPKEPEQEPNPETESGPKQETVEQEPIEQMDAQEPEGPEQIPVNDGPSPEDHMKEAVWNNAKASLQANCSTTMADLDALFTLNDDVRKASELTAIKAMMEEAMKMVESL